MSRPERQTPRPPRRPPAQALDADALYDCAVRALAHRSRSEAEVRRHLGPRALDPADIDTVLARLREHRYLDDARLARAAASYEHEVFHHGRERALRDLLARGLHPALARQAVDQGYATLDEMALLEAFLIRKRLGPPTNLRQTGNLIRKLRVAGFSLDACRRQLSAWQLPAEWLDDGLGDAFGPPGETDIM